MIRYSQMNGPIVLLLAAAAAFAQSDAPATPARDLAAERQQALSLLNQGRCQAALPLAEDLVAANPDDAVAQGWLGYCLFNKSRLTANPDEAQALRKRAREAAVRSRQLGNKWPLLNDLFIAIDTPGAAEQPFSSNAEANAKMKEGEAAFSKGDNEGALAAYSAALKLDPQLYHAALFAGDVCFRAKDTACAADWFSKAVAIAPTHETAYRYWGDALMAAGKMMEARDKFIEAVIAEPGQKPWAGLMNWAKRNDCTLTAPKIDRPKIEARLGDNPQTMTVSPQDLEDKDGTGRAAWLAYGITRAAWRQALFAKTYPNETQYRHTLAEETAALTAVANAVERLNAPHLDPLLANVLALKRDGLLEAWILLNGGPDPSLAPDYAPYRDAHHAEIRAYFDKYIIHPNRSAP